MNEAIIIQLDNLNDQLQSVQDTLEQIRCQSNVDAQAEQRLAGVCDYIQNAMNELEDIMMYEHYKGYNG